MIFFLNSNYKTSFSSIKFKLYYINILQPNCDPWFITSSSLSHPGQTLEYTPYSPVDTSLVQYSWPQTTVASTIQNLNENILYETESTDIFSGKSTSQPIFDPWHTKLSSTDSSLTLFQNVNSNQKEIYTDQWIPNFSCLNVNYLLFFKSIKIKLFNCLFTDRTTTSW